MVELKGKERQKLSDVLVGPSVFDLNFLTIKEVDTPPRNKFATSILTRFERLDPLTSN